MSLKGSPLVIDYRWDIFERNAFWTYRSTCNLSWYWYLDASGGSQLERLLGYDKHRSVSQKYTFYDSHGYIELGHQTGDWHPCFLFPAREWKEPLFTARIIHRHRDIEMLSPLYLSDLSDRYIRKRAARIKNNTEESQITNCCEIRSQILSKIANSSQRCTSIA